MTKPRFVFSPVGPATSLRQGLLLGALAALCAGAAPAAAQTYVGNNFLSGSGLLSALQTDGNADKYPPFVILQEYSPSGPATTGAIFGSAGTVNDVSFYGSGNYDFTVYALAPDGSPAPNEQKFTVAAAQPFSGTVASPGVYNLSALRALRSARVTISPSLEPALGIRKRRTTPSARTRPTKVLRSPRSIPRASPRSPRPRACPSQSGRTAIRARLTKSSQIHLRIGAETTR
jgi:hypothetical protein